MSSNDTPVRPDPKDLGGLFTALSGDEYAAVVCVEHQRFIPCRVCMYVQPATVPYSDDPVAVARVRAFQGS